MRTLIKLHLLLALSLFTGCASVDSANECSAAADEATPEITSIGTATMDQNRAIHMKLSTYYDGMFIKSHPTYYPYDERYPEIIRHLGGLEPGETKSVPPWPSSQD